MVDRAVAEVATGQHGVVTVRQLREVGLDKSAISRRVRSGRLHPVHRGVYAVGHPPLSWEAWWMAAVLACGEEAVLSHASAAALWGFLRPIDGPIDVSVRSSSGRSKRDGIRIHRCASLAVAQSSRHARGTRHEPLVTRRRGIPVTTPARTIDDLRGSVAPNLVRRAARQAQLAGWRVGVVSDRARSDLEEDFLALCRRHRLPTPEVNVKVGRFTVDFLWRAQRVVVETDAWGTHRGSVAFDDDHARDLELRRRGFAVHRYTEAQVRDTPDLVVADLRAVLGGGS
jgi:very-short-patch-repair endonuclease